MAQQYQHLDLTTLQEVERLLTTADFANATPTNAPRREVLVSSSEGPAPLPKRG